MMWSSKLIGYCKCMLYILTINIACILHNALGSNNNFLECKLKDWKYNQNTKCVLMGGEEMPRGGCMPPETSVVCTEGFIHLQFKQNIQSHS